MGTLLSQVDILLLSAGFGRRLRPLTDTLPKALVRVAGKTLIERHLEQLAAQGAQRVVINLHHLGDQIRQFAGDGSRWGVAIAYSPEPVILDTGGAIKKIEAQLKGRALLTINADVILDDRFQYAGLIADHLSSANDPPLATMLLRKDPEQQRYGEIGINNEGVVVQFLDVHAPADGSVASSDLFMFCGIQVLAPAVFPYLPEAEVPCSITRDVLKPLVAGGFRLKGVPFDGLWFDVGTPERLKAAELAL